MSNNAALNLIAENITKGGPSDRITAAELRAVLQLLAKQLSETIAYSAAIPFSRAVSYMGTKVVDSNIVFTINETDKTPGFGTLIRLIGNGVNTPDFSNFTADANSPEFDNTEDAVNLCFFFYDGVDFVYSITQTAGTSSVPEPDITAPTLVSAIITDAEKNKVALTYNEAINSGVGLSHTDFTLTNGKTATAIEIAGSVIKVTANSNWANGDVVAITGGAGKIRDLAGNAAANLSSQAVTNNIAGGVTQLTAPTLALNVIGDTELQAVWDNVSNEDGYTVEIATDAGFTTNLQTASKGANVTSHNFTGLTAGTLYYGRVKAEGSGSYSDSNYGTDSESTSGGGGGYDADAATYFATDTGLTSGEKTAINTAFVDLKNASLFEEGAVFSDVVFFMCFLGDTVAKRTRNAKTPGAAYTIQGTPTFDATGIKFNGTSYIRTGITSTTIPNDDQSIFCYANNQQAGIGNGNGYAFGNYDGTGSNGIAVSYRDNAGDAYFFGGSVSVAYGGGLANGLVEVLARPNTHMVTFAKAASDNTDINIGANGGSDGNVTSTAEWCIGSLMHNAAFANEGGLALYVHIKRGLSDADRAAVKTILNTLKTALGR
jgi:hypothetical protein